MSSLLVENKQIVFPGETLAQGMDYLPSGDVVRVGENLLATKIGMISVDGRVLKLLPLTGPYIPRRRNTIIGQVSSIGLSGWRLNIRWPFDGNLGLAEASSDYIERGSDLSKYFKVGDYLMVQVTNVASSKVIDLTAKGPGLGKLGVGRVFQVKCTKVPRIIGKQGSMVSLIKDFTKCRISVGQNGRVWLSGEDPKLEDLAVRAIEMIEREGHVPGLTDRVKAFLEKETKQ